MGLAALRKILVPRPADVAEFRGRVVAVDADNLLWTFVTAMAAAGEPPKGPDGRSVAHVLGLVNRLKWFADNGVRSAWVFDGEQPALKEATLAARWDRIEAARDAGNAQAGAAFTEADAEDAKRVMTTLGVPWTVAPAESDAQCAFLARRGDAYAAVTQDYDAPLHGSPLTARNLTASKTRAPEAIDLAAGLAAAGITREQLVDAAVLIGTDYNAGVKGVGPVKALKLVKREGDLHGALASLGVEMPEADAVRALFLDHRVDASWRPAFGAPDEAAFRDIMRGFGLGDARSDRVLAAVGALHASP